MLTNLQGSVFLCKHASHFTGNSYPEVILCFKRSAIVVQERKKPGKTLFTDPNRSVNTKIGKICNY